MPEDPEYLRRLQEAETFRKQWAEKDRFFLLHQQSRFQPHSAQGIAIAQLLDAMNQRDEALRHAEATALSRQEIAASHRSNRLAIVAIVVAVVALAVAILGWMFPRQPLATGHAASAIPPAPATIPTNTAPVISLPATN